MNREQEIVARSKAFREEYRETTPGWYRGEIHLAFTLCFTVGTIVYCASQLASPRWQEWAFVMLPMLLFGNWAEWAAHRYLLHRDRKSVV